eukprot:m.222515 g.222515  ORF g.222515 m.222515 type:complete len:116 (-) comp15625_c0_seq5:973-1320(-)
MLPRYTLLRRQMEIVTERTSDRQPLLFTGCLQVCTSQIGPTLIAFVNHYSLLIFIINYYFSPTCPGCVRCVLRRCCCFSGHLSVFFQQLLDRLQNARRNTIALKGKRSDFVVASQ